MPKTREFGMEENSISDNILEKAQGDIRAMLQNQGLSKTDRLQLEIQSYFLMFLVNDHKKINKIYPYFQKQIAREKHWTMWWDRLQWVAIPMILLYLMSFVSRVWQFIVEVMKLV